MEDLKRAARALADAAQALAAHPTNTSLHGIEPAVAQLWRTYRADQYNVGPVAPKQPHDLPGRLSAEAVMVTIGIPGADDLEEVAERINLRFCKIVRGREGYVRGQEEEVMSVIGMAALRAFYSGLLCCYGRRAVESAPFVRQLAETTCQFATIAKVQGAAHTWAQRDDDPPGLKGKQRVKFTLWRETFERKGDDEVRFNHLTADHRDAIEHAWEAGSDMTHTRWGRVMGIPQTQDNGDMHLNIEDPPALVVMMLRWLVDVAYRCTEEMGVAWRARDASFQAFDDGLDRDIPVLHAKYKRVSKRLRKAQK